MCIKNNLIDSDDNTYLIVHSLIDIINIITGSNSITLKKLMLNGVDMTKCRWIKF